MMAGRQGDGGGSAPGAGARPAISVCLPNLNNARFLPERIRTVREQRFQDYEVVVFDNHSDDGAYEILREYARQDPRVRLEQAPREGMYANWNNCLRAARGEWVYVATSDDTMRADCLERLHEAGVRAAGSGMVTSLPWVIDEQGRSQVDWREPVCRWLLGRRCLSSGWASRRSELLGAMVFGTPTLSITQCLIRAETFRRVGFFPTAYGSAGDFVWQLRVLQEVPVYHVGRRLGSWRRHASQATGTEMRVLFERRARILLDWYLECRPQLDAGLAAAMGYSLAVGGVDATEGLPGEVQRWRGRFRGWMDGGRTWVRPTVVGALCRWLRQGAAAV